MKKVFNRKQQKEKRQYLRNHMTKAEITLWYSLKGKQLLGYKFRRQHGIDRYIVDFYCPELRLAIELDGESHISEDARVDDMTRQNVVEQHGVRFLRFTDDEVLGNPDRVVKTIEDIVVKLSSTTPARLSGKSSFTSRRSGGPSSSPSTTRQGRRPMGSLRPVRVVDPPRQEGDFL